METGNGLSAVQASRALKHYALACFREISEAEKSPAHGWRAYRKGRFVTVHDGDGLIVDERIWKHLVVLN